MKLLQHVALAGALTLCAIEATATTVTLQSTLNPAFVGSPVTFTATVTGTAPTGTVEFRDGAMTISGCAAVPLSGTPSTPGAACTPALLISATHQISAYYSGDGANSAASNNLTQSIVLPVPGNGTVISNPYGTMTVQGATLSGGNVISNLSNNVVIQLGNVAGTPGQSARIDFQGFNIGPGGMIYIRSGAANQVVYLVDTSTSGTLISGFLTANDFGGAGFPILYLKNRNGITISAGAALNAHDGIGVDSLGATWTDGSPLVNNGVIDAGANMELLASRITGSGEFRGNTITLHTFGNANNPVNGAFYLQNGLLLQSGNGTGPGTTVDLTVNAYGTAPQVLNFRSLSNLNVWMPSVWPIGNTYPQNNMVVAPDETRPAGVPDPAYGGGSMIVQSDHALTLVDGGRNDFAFPGAIVLKSGGTLDLNAVTVNQGWTTTGKSFQGLFFESPNIVSPPGLIKVYGNDLNWANFSSLPHAGVRAFTLKRNANGGAGFAPADNAAPHLNTYSVLANTAASGGCWTCLVNPQPVNMYIP